MKDSTRKSVQKFYQRWFGAMAQEDIDGFLALLADDFYIKTPGQPAITDAFELRKGLEQYHHMFKSAVDWEIEETQFFENHALVRVTEKVTLINRQTEETGQHEGVHLALLTKTNSGWEVKTDVSSLNQTISSDGNSIMHKIPESLEKRHSQWVEIVNTGDIEAYADLLTEKAVWIPPGQKPIVGRKAFREWLAPFMSKFSYDFSITGEKIKVSADWAFERARFISKMTPREGGKPMEHTGTFTVLWKRGSDNNWYIERYIDDSEF